MIMKIIENINKDTFETAVNNYIKEFRVYLKPEIIVTPTTIYKDGDSVTGRLYTAVIFHD